MAFTETQRVYIASEILEIDPDIFYLHLTSGAFELTSAKQTFIEDRVAEWDASAKGDFTEVHPNLKNFGAKIDPALLKTHIRKAIANAMGRPDWASASSLAEFEMVRG